MVIVFVLIAALGLYLTGFCFMKARGVIGLLQAPPVIDPWAFRVIAGLLILSSLYSLFLAFGLARAIVILLILLALGAFLNSFLIGFSQGLHRVSLWVSLGGLALLLGIAA